jgi:FKBP-type peptidyl-prolyl cis-trans isomerase
VTQESSRRSGNRAQALRTVGRLLLAVVVLAALMLAMSGCTASPSPQSSTAAPTTEASPTAQAATEPTPAADAQPNPATTPPSPPVAQKLKIKDIKKGKGAVAKAGMTVSVHYTGWLTNGTKFDSSVDRGQPFSFALGAGQVIVGWDQGVAGMKVGGVRELIIPPSLGYGAQGTPGGPIPPNATLKFRVELLSVSAGQ